jgi:U3 small nucleolar RNA-associated protein 21
MAVFLKLHGEDVAGNAALTDALETWRQCQESEGARVGELVGFCSGVVGFLRYPNKF